MKKFYYRTDIKLKDLKQGIMYSFHGVTVYFSGGMIQVATYKDDNRFKLLKDAINYIKNDLFNSVA